MEKNTLMTISLPGGWTLQHDPKACGGPTGLAWNGAIVLSDFHCRFDDLTDAGFAASAVRFFRKGGQGVASSEGSTRPLAGNSLRQITRYGANTARVTWDLAWRKDTPAKTGVEIGSANLAGAWRRALVLPDYAACQGGSTAAWQDLAPGQSLVFSPIPMAVVLERADGVQVEFSMGFDVWRWQHGLGDFGPDGARVVLTVNAEHMTFQRQLLHCREEVIPEAREYRFCSQIAWRAPAAAAAAPPAFPPPVGLTFQADGNGLCALPPAGPDGVLSYALDLSAMPVPAAARRDDGSGLPCWESNVTQRAARRAIRQLAGSGAAGFLRLDGLTPGLCGDGSHCDRRRGAAHWDLQGILTFAAWARQCLGDAWTLAAPQLQEPWLHLPSLADPLAVTGFRTSTDDE